MPFIVDPLFAFPIPTEPLFLYRADPSLPSCTLLGCKEPDDLQELGEWIEDSVRSFPTNNTCSGKTWKLSRGFRNSRSGKPPATA
jgi:hypothetical protein